MSYVVVAFNGWDDEVENVWGPFDTEEAARAWIDANKDGYGCTIHAIEPADALVERH